MALQTKRVYIDTTRVTPVTGHSVNTTAAALADPAIMEIKTYSIAASGSVNATAATGFDNVLKTALVSAIDTDIAAVDGFGINTTASHVSYNAKVLSVKSTSLDSIFQTDAVRTFSVEVELSLTISSAS